MHVCMRHLQMYVFIHQCICDLNMFNTHVYTTHVLMHACMFTYVRTYIKLIQVCRYICMFVHVCDAYKCVYMYLTIV